MFLESWSRTYLLYPLRILLLYRICGREKPLCHGRHHHGPLTRSSFSHPTLLPLSIFTRYEAADFPYDFFCLAWRGSCTVIHLAEWLERAFQGTHQSQDNGCPGRFWSALQRAELVLYTMTVSKLWLYVQTIQDYETLNICKGSHIRGSRSHTLSESLPHAYYVNITVTSRTTTVLTRQCTLRPSIQCENIEGNSWKSYLIYFFRGQTEAAL